MNCKQVEELLPLYVGQDLEDERTSLITAHVSTCTQCARSAEEYVDASQLLQQFAAPQFSEATYATVRQSVLREIERESGTWTLRELLLGPFQPRLRWAVSTVVLLAVCAFAYYFVANRANVPHDQKANAEIKLAPAGTAGGSPALATTPSNSPLNQVARHQLVAPSPAGALHSPAAATNSQKARLNQTPRHNGTAISSPATAMSSRKPGLNQTAGKPTRAGEPPAVPGAVPAAIDTSVSSRKPMRLEIQTRDPNIRIIWFSQPSTNEGSPNEFSKGI